MPPRASLDPLSFAYWLQGLFELTQGDASSDPRIKGFTPAQAKLIAEHLDLVFNKVTGRVDLGIADVGQINKGPTYCSRTADVVSTPVC